MRCPKCKYIVAEYFKTCPECEEDLSNLSLAFGPFYEPDPALFEGSLGGEETLYDKLEEPEDILPQTEEETIAVAEAENSDFELLEIEEDEAEEFPFEEVEEADLDAVEELPEIELAAEDLEGSLEETLTEKDEESEALDLFDEIEGLEEILPEEVKEG